MNQYPPESRLLAGATAPSSISHPHGDDSISLRQIIGVIRRHYKLVLAVTIVGAGLGAYVGASQHAQYEANGVMRLALERRSLTGDMERTPELGRNADPMISTV